MYFLQTWYVHWYCGALLWDCYMYGQILSIFEKRYLPQYLHIYFLDNNLGKFQWVFKKFDTCIDIVETCFDIAHWHILSIFFRVICPWHDNGGVLSFHVLFICCGGEIEEKYTEVSRQNLPWFNTKFFVILCTKSSILFIRNASIFKFSLSKIGCQFCSNQ